MCIRDSRYLWRARRRPRFHRVLPSVWSRLRLLLGTASPHCAPCSCAGCHQEQASYQLAQNSHTCCLSRTTGIGKEGCSLREQPLALPARDESCPKTMTASDPHSRKTATASFTRGHSAGSSTRHRCSWRPRAMRYVQGSHLLLRSRSCRAQCVTLSVSTRTSSKQLHWDTTLAMRHSDTLEKLSWTQS